MLDAFDVEPSQKSEGPFVSYKGELTTNGGDAIDVRVFTQAALGRAHAAALVTYILLTFEVDIIVVTGLCGGLRRRSPQTKQPIALGDVIFGDLIVEAEIRKFVSREFEIRNLPWRTNLRLEMTARELQSRFDSRELLSTSTRTNEWFDTTRASFHCGTIVSLGSVVADRIAVERLSIAVAKAVPSRPIAVEMEGNGILTAASIFEASDNVAMIRAVSDFADESKNDGARSDACRNAAFASLEFIRSYFDVRSGFSVSGT
ncbi:MAG: hypothetical protein JSR60_15485 [Proteobacteria bacterium]|nr:hypothetical protein [Pseudomonadota bacterium]